MMYNLWNNGWALIAIQIRIQQNNLTLLLSCCAMILSIINATELQNSSRKRKRTEEEAMILHLQSQANDYALTLASAASFIRQRL